MRGLTLFSAKARRRPLAAVGGIAVDYLTYIGMCLFALLVFAARRPLRAIDRIFRTRTRERLTDLVARISHG